MPLSPHAWKTLFRVINVPMLLVSRQQDRILNCNKAFEKLTGYREKEIRGQICGELDLWQGSSTHDDRYAAPESSGGNPQTKQYVRTSAGKHLPVTVGVTDFQSGDEKLTAYSILSIKEEGDIPETPSGKPVLNQDDAHIKQWLQAILRNAPITIFVIDHEGRFTLSEGRGLARVGLKPGENVGESAYELYEVMEFLGHDGTVLKGSEVIRKAMAGETINALSQLNDIWFDNRIGPMSDKNGEIIGIVGVATDITEQIHAKQRLSESEIKFRNLFNNAGVGMFRTKFDGSAILDVNERFLEIFGRKREEMIGEPTLMHWADPQERTEMAERLRENGIVTDFECKMLNRNGEVRNCLTSVRLYPYEGILEGAIIDITDRKRIENALQQSEQKFRTAFIHNQIAMALGTRDDGRFTEVNPALLAMIERSREDVLGKTAAELGLWPDPEEGRRIASIVKSEGKIHGIERRLSTRSGKLLTVWFSSDILELEGRQYIYACLQDITEWIRTQQLLRESEEKFRMVFHRNQMPMLLTTMEEGRLVDANKEFLRLMGVTENDIIGRTTKEIEIWENATEREHVIALLKSEGTIHRRETRIKTASGKKLTVVYSMDILAMQGATYICSSIQDITESRKLKDDLQERDAQLIQADKMASLGTIVSGVAHELNNPTNFIMMNVPLLRMAFENALPLLKSTEVSETYVGKMPMHEFADHVFPLLDGIAEGSKRIKRIVSDLKDYARPDPGNLQAEVDLVRVIHSAISLLNNGLKKKNVDLQTVTGGNPVLVRGNFQRLEQVIINILQNSCDALSGNGEHKIMVTIDDSLSHDVVLSVSDNGCGIAHEDLGRIFDPFFTTKRSNGGTGLGLSISNKIINDHGGRLLYESEVDRGTTVKIMLPRKRK